MRLSCPTFRAIGTFQKKSMFKKSQRKLGHPPVGMLSFSFFHLPPFSRFLYFLFIFKKIFMCPPPGAPNGRKRAGGGNIACCPRLSRCWRRGGAKFVGYHPELGIAFENAFHRARSTLLRISLTSNP